MKMKCTRALSPLQCIRSVTGEAVLLYVRMNIMKKIFLGTATWSPSLSDLEGWARQVTPAAELCPFTPFNSSQRI